MQLCSLLLMFLAKKSKKKKQGFKRDYSHVKLCTHVESTAASNPVLIVGEEH